MKIIFMGTPEFSCPSLETIITSQHDVVAVYTQAPKAAGRGQKERKSPIHILAEKNNINVYTPASLQGDKEQQELFDLKADLIIVSAYGIILPKIIIDNFLCVNIHASLLPRWRGAAPIQRAIIAGDKISGITMMKMDEGLDTGDIISMQQVPIGKSTTGGMLHDNLSYLASQMILPLINDINNNSFKATKQPQGATYADKIKKSESVIDWNMPAIKIIRYIRAFNPWPVMRFTHNDNIIKIFDADYEISNSKSKPGEIINDKFSIACSDGIIYPKILQREGKKPMDINNFILGYKI